jgi:hypothetical protein
MEENLTVGDDNSITEAGAMDRKAFESVKGQIGYCGLWCGSCIVGNGTLRELTVRYRELIKGHGVEEWGLKDQGMDGDGFMNALIAIENIAICPGCLKGGGNDACTMRPCAREKKASDCIECREKATCKNLDPLERVRTGGSKAGMLMKDERGEPDIVAWVAELKGRFPHSMIWAEKA